MLFGARSLAVVFLSVVFRGHGHCLGALGRRFGAEEGRLQAFVYAGRLVSLLIIYSQVGFVTISAE